MTTYRQAKKNLETLLKQKKDLTQAIKQAKEDLVDAESRRKFKCNQCGKSTPYHKTTLYIKEHYEPPDAYSGDYVTPLEYQIVCSCCGIHHRFLSDESLEKYSIPFKEVEHWGSTRKEHDFGWFDNLFLKKFEKVERGYTKQYKFTNH